ncbi:putative death-receptor fusion protein-domain-containing protein [Chytridium lagenaria]|nr:putative death-receptor fusion protein-domain-containing protein [Chytridium lagenaria]
MMSAFSVSTTRRSAGLPLAISAILINPSPFQTQLLASTMKTLFAEAKVPVNVPEGKVLLDVPQIHAFNIMRELLLHAELSNHMRDYIGQAFILSIESFSSPYFPLRNCATMLFSTLVSKSLGTKRDKNEDDDTNTVTTRAFFSKFPELYSFLLKVLEKDGLVDVNEKDISKSLVYPVLTILVRLKPLKTSSHHDGFDMKRFEAAIEKCLSLPFWQLRDIAARSFAALISADGVVAKVRDIIDKVTEMCTEDETHGLLLQATYLILNGKREGAIGVEAVSLLTAWAEKSWLFSRLTLVNKAAALRILNILLDDAIKLPESLAAKLWSVPVKEVWQICCKTIDLPSTRHPGEVRFQKEATRFILEVCSVIEGDYSKTTSSKIFGVVSKNIIKHDTPMQVEALSFLKRFYFRRALNSMERKDVLDMLSALLAEESTPDIIKSDAGRFLVVLGKETTIPVNSILYKLGQMLEESKGSKMALLLALYCSQVSVLRGLVLMN